VTVAQRVTRLKCRQYWYSVGLLVLIVLVMSILIHNVIGQDLTTPSQATDWALADQMNLPELDRPWHRYLWIPPWDKTDTSLAAASFALNTAASHAGILVQPRVMANGWMLAVDLRRMAPRIEQLALLVETWDGLAVREPYFHVFQETEDKRVAVLAPHIKETHAKLLAELNVSPALVYRLDWFLSQLLDSAYYDFMQFGDNLESVLTTVGVDEVLAQRINGDQRVAIFSSNVTGKPRRVDRIQGAAGRFNTSAVWITRDLFDEQAAIASHPIYNLLAFEEDGSEIIFERPNGMHGFVLVNSAGKLVREAPPNLVSDHTIPAPHTRRLRPAISCIRCHGDQEGLQSVSNDVRTLLSVGAIDVLNDFGNAKTSREELLDRLAGLYAGDFTRRIKLGRDDYSLATRIATAITTRPEGLTVPEASAIVSELYGEYVYNSVDAETACRELGYNPGDDPRTTLSQILPTLPPDPQSGLTLEDPTAAALRAGISVRRIDFERIYSTARLLVSRKENDNENN